MGSGELLISEVIRIVTAKEIEMDLLLEQLGMNNQEFIKKFQEIEVKQDAI